MGAVAEIRVAKINLSPFLQSSKNKSVPFSPFLVAGLPSAELKIGGNSKKNIAVKIRF